MKLDLLLRNADIITMDERRPHATSLGVWQGRIVGLDDDLDGLDAAEVLDLDGATVTPGFIDAHCHTTWFGLGLGEVDVSAARGLNQLYALLEAGHGRGRRHGSDEGASGAASQRTGPGWLLATGFSQTAARRRVPGHHRAGPDHGKPAAVHPAQLRPHGRGQHRRAPAGRRRARRRSRTPTAA